MILLFIELILFFVYLILVVTDEKEIDKVFKSIADKIKRK